MPTQSGGMEIIMKIAIGADSAGFAMKEELKAHLAEGGHEVVDCGAFSDARCDYPKFACKVCEQVTEADCTFGILVCGTGIGMSMAANKVRGIRAAVVSEHFSARYTRLHNDANVLCLGARVIGSGLAAELVDLFISTPAEGGRHANRVDMIMKVEKDGVHALDD